MDVFSQMLWPLMACFILVGIHAYLGIHVLARKVIFVDLALAQIAGLGAVYGVFLGLSFENDPWVIKAISVCFTLLGALLVALTRTRDEQIPHEAIIGIIYASALSLTVLLTSNLPHGAEEVQQMLAGSILWVRPQEVVQTAFLYGFIGFVHIIFRRQFFQLSSDLALKNTPTTAMRLWDFLFYATFGVVVTSSVGIGGVLLVFGYLVIPSVIGVMVTDNLVKKLLVAWLSGIAMSVLGVVVSYYADLPTGPCIVVLLCLLLILINFIQKPVFIKLVMGVFVIFSLVLISYLIKNRSGHEFHHAMSHKLGHHEEDLEIQQALIKNLLASSDNNEVLNGLNSIRPEMKAELEGSVVALLEHSDSHVRERVAQIIVLMKWIETLPALQQAFKYEQDDFIKLEIAEATLSLGDAQGFSMLSYLWRKSKSELARNDALLHVRKWFVANNLPDEALIKFLEQKHEKIELDEKTSKFIVK
jgi:zinc/manganese transport system permease protein